MALKTATRRTKRISGTPTFKYWPSHRNPCRFLHGLRSPSSHYHRNANTPKYVRKPHSYVHKTIKHESKAVKPHFSSDKTTKYDIKEVSNKETRGRAYEITFGEASQKISMTSICKYWMSDNSVHCDPCQNLRSWSCGDRMSILAKLHEHNKVMTGITLPVGSDKLYGTLCTLGCHTGRCVNVINLGSEISSLIWEEPWIFVGVKNAIKAWNFLTAAGFTLNGPEGQVLSMIVGDDTLFAGAEDGVIYAWRGSSDPDAKCPFELVASLRGHTKAISCLTLGCDKIYSGSMDGTIKVWGLYTLDCKITLGGHTTTITSLVCWADYLLSSSVDGALKFWEMTEDGILKVAHTHMDENGILALCGMNESQGEHIVFFSCKDNSVRMYELPTFSETGPEGLLFTGDDAGLLTV